MISIKSSGSFDRTKLFFDRVSRGDIYSELNKYGQMGVDALARATPTDTGRTASSWVYEITRRRGGASIEWRNNHVNQGAVIALLIQYGHGTGTGGYVAGYDYINPAIRPIFDRIAEEVWKKVTAA